MTTDTPTSTPASTVEQEFRAFASSGLQIGASMLAALSAAERQTVERALQAGARLSLEFGPLPAFERLHLVLIEREGARHGLATVSVNQAPVK